MTHMPCPHTPLILQLHLIALLVPLIEQPLKEHQDLVFVAKLLKLLHLLRVLAISIISTPPGVPILVVCAISSGTTLSTITAANILGHMVWLASIDG